MENWGKNTCSVIILFIENNYFKILFEVQILVKSIALFYSIIYGINILFIQFVRL